MMNNAQDVVNEDLSYICNSLKEELLKLSGKEVLIAGGAGFLGYYLVQAILHWNSINAKYAPIQLTVHDNFIRGVPRWLENLDGCDNFKTKKRDVTEKLQDDENGFQYIIHAASIASPIYYRKYPIETMDANINGLRNLLDFCIAKKNQGQQIEGFL